MRRWLHAMAYMWPPDFIKNSKEVGPWDATESFRFCPHDWIDPVVKGWNIQKVALL